MDFSAYGDLDKEDKEEAPTLQPVVLNRDKLGIVAAPAVVDTSMTERVLDFNNSLKVYTNPTYSDLWQKPVQGASAPWSDMKVVRGGSRNILTGFVEDTTINDWAFDQQMHAFQSKGEALDPSSNNTVIKYTEQKKRKAERKEEPPAPKQVIHREPGADEYEKIAEQMEEKESDDEDKPADKKKQKPAYEPTVVFHQQMARDYQGRSWCQPSSSLKKDKEHKCFLPKKCIHTWSGHSKGVSQIRFFPGYGHLLLSASFDNTVKIWDVYGKRQCIQTWAAHEKGVKDINFSPDGTRFLSCGYDNFTRLFDVESGKCLASFTKHKTPHCCVFYPREPNIFLVGQANKKVIQYDFRLGHSTVQYDRHLGAINTVSFIEDNRKFVTTSDDKSIRVWDFGVHIETKYIAEPHMHAITQTRKTYDDKWLMCQSNDNQILVYSAKDKFKLNRKKNFKGHTNTGFSIGLDSSPDGQYVVSGTSDGGLSVWDWQTTKMIKTLKAHQKVTSGCAWHPIEPSKIASCSWDGTIKFWD